LTSGIAPIAKISAKSEALISFPISDVKDGAAEKIINFPAQYGGLASSVLIDNQDSSNSVTVKINRGFQTITVPASTFRAFNDSWIEQINLTGASTNTQVTADIVSREQIGV